MSDVDYDPGTVLEALNNKADIDLGNVTASVASAFIKSDLSNVGSTQKETIVGWGMPDFSAGVSKSLNTVYQAEKDGWIVIHGWQTSNGNANVELQYSVDGTFSDGITVIKNYTGNSTQTEGSFIAPIPKGIYYRSTEIGSLHSFIFYPCKGV